MNFQDWVAKRKLHKTTALDDAKWAIGTLLRLRPDLLEKGGKRAKIGEIREWSSGTFRKEADGWVPVEGSVGAKESTPPEDHTETSTPTEKADATPREQAETKPDYLNARKSKYSNVGEDVKGAARHARAYNSRELRTNDAEIKIKYLLEAEPVNLLDDVSSSNPINPYVCQKVLDRFPEFKGAERENYLDAFDMVKGLVESHSKPENAGISYVDALKNIQTKVVDFIKSKRAEGKGHCDFLIRYVNSTLGRYPSKGTVAQDIFDYKEVVKKDGKDFVEFLKSDEGIRATKDLIEGKHISKVFNIEKEGDGKKKFSMADYYIQEAKRKGPETELNSVDQQTDFITKGCGIRAIQWGNSVTDKEREHHLKFTAEALKDLSDVLGLPEQMVSFNGRLALSIGARGTGSALAHYEFDKTVINLTRAKGVGSLAHEWGHFIDNILGQTHKLNAASDNMFVSEGAYFTISGEASPIRDSMKEMMKSPEWSEYTDSCRKAFRAATEMGLKVGKSSYWFAPREMFARAFECYIKEKLAEKGRENTYLSGVTDNALFNPSPDLTKKLVPMMDKLFKAISESDHIKKALDILTNLRKDETWDINTIDELKSAYQNHAKQIEQHNNSVSSAEDGRAQEHAYFDGDGSDEYPYAISRSHSNSESFPDEDILTINPHLVTHPDFHQAMQGGFNGYRYWESRQNLNDKESPDKKEAYHSWRQDIIDNIQQHFPSVDWHHHWTDSSYAELPDYDEAGNDANMKIRISDHNPSNGPIGISSDINLQMPNTSKKPWEITSHGDLDRAPHSVDLFNKWLDKHPHSIKNSKIDWHKKNLVDKSERILTNLRKDETNLVYVACDGDNIGASVERAALKDDIEEIKRQSELIEVGQAIIDYFARKYDGEVYIHGGDDVSFTLNAKHVDQLPVLVESYKTATGYTLTIGVGPTISKAGRAMLWGKLHGKDQIAEWSPKIDKELGSYKGQSTEDKLKEEGLLDGEWHDQLEGGLANKKNPKDFDRDQLIAGMRVETEHVNDPLKALEIAMDHITENPKYYDKLKIMEESTLKELKDASHNDKNSKPRSTKEVK